MRAAAFMVVLSMILVSTVALADVPGLISYQGTLTDEQGVAMDTTVSMVFSIYTDSTGGTLIWTETQPAVEVNSGVFNVLLGRVNAISDTFFNDPSRWLGVQVGGDAELQPRQRIASVGYSFRSAEADTADYARLAPAVTDGDWTISGNDMYSAVSGDVGIGTAVPSALLHAQVPPGHDTSSDFHFKFINTQSGVAAENAGMLVRGGGNSNSVSALEVQDHDSNLDFVVKGDGSVGIGTSSPTYKLDIESGSNTVGLMVSHRGASGYIRQYWSAARGQPNGNTGHLTVYPTDDATYPGHIRFGGTSFTSVLEFVPGSSLGNFAFTDGDVGIGTTNPVSKLHLEGNFEGGEGITLTHLVSDDPAVRFYSRSDRRWGISSTSADGEFNIRELDGSWNTVGSRLAIIPGGNVGIGTTSPTEKLHVAGTAKVDGTLFSSIVSSSSPLQLQTDGTTRVYVDDIFGNVGIGTLSPANKLDVEGGIAIGATYSGTSAAPSNGSIIEGAVGIGTTSPANKLDVEGGMAIGATYSGASAAPSNGLIIEGAVGIGTTSPGDGLDVNGDIRVRGADIKDAGGTARVTLTDNWSLDLKEDDGSTALSIATTGNVGIGTTSPDATLQVDGTMKIFGAWDDTKSFGPVYQAPSDGFVVAIAAEATDGQCSILRGYTDSSPDPGTLRGQASRRMTSNFNYDFGDSFTMPVRKGDYWKVTEDNAGFSPAVCYLYWIPLGN